MGTQLLVVSRKGVMRYDASPYFIKHNLKCAFGDGAQFAYGALAMGASAAEAVAIASQYSPTCGQGMDIFTFHEDGEIGHEVREP
jgi:predicted lipoprotein with Yx(FWY)xxD motif